MTVQELIEKLQEVEDKSRICLVEDSDENLWEIKPGGIYHWFYEGSNASLSKSPVVATCSVFLAKRFLETSRTDTDESDASLAA